MKAKSIEQRMRESGVKITDVRSGRQYHAFIEPLRYKSRMYLESVHTPVGCASESRFLYLGPPEFDVTQLAETDFIESNGRSYYCLLAEPVWFSDEIIYYRAVLKRTRGDE